MNNRTPRARFLAAALSALLLAVGAFVLAPAAHAEVSTPLQIAVGGCNMEAVTILIEAGANVMVRDQNGDTLLHSAARTVDRTCAMEMVRILIELGMDPNAKNKDGETPLYWATYRENVEMMRMLIKAGANPDMKE